MIKRYKQFIEKLNENNQLDSEYFTDMLSDVENEVEIADEETDGEVEEEEEEDLYKSKLNDLANLLGTDVKDNHIIYNGQKIIYPSETNMFHVGKRKFDNIDKVSKYLGISERKKENKH